MSKRSSVSVNLEASAESDPRPPKPESETPFRLLLMGDFSGRANRGELAAGRWQPLLIDRDNFDAVLARVRPELALGPSGRRIELPFRELDDFLPDRIYEDNPVFTGLRELRRKLGNPATFAEGAATVRQWTGTTPAATPASPAPDSPKTPGSGVSLLDDILATSESAPAQGSPRRDGLQAFIHGALAGHVSAGPDPQLPELLALVDGAASRLMRAILHDPDFQALEAAWRAVFQLVRAVETGPMLKVYLLDVSKAEVAADLHASEDPRTSAMHRLLAQPGAGTEPWAVIAANFTFARTEQDTRLLLSLSQIARSAGAPFLAEIGLDEEPSPSAERLWAALRRSSDASWIGLLLPRFLLRLPYGSQTDSLENFPFEEMPGTPLHRNYLWGNPAFAAAWLLAESFSVEQWALRPGSAREIAGLPLHVRQTEGGPQATPCAEVLMSEQDADWVLEHGFMPLLSVKDQDSVRVLRFQSIAEPLAPLSGRWR